MVLHLDLLALIYILQNVDDDFQKRNIKLKGPILLIVRKTIGNVLRKTTGNVLRNSLLITMYDLTYNIDLHAFICISHNSDDDFKKYTITLRGPIC